MKYLREVPDDTYGIHGTALTSIIPLLKGKPLPNPRFEGYYFATIDDRLQNSDLGKTSEEYCEYDLEFALETSSFYAENSAQKYFLQRRFGEIPEWFYENKLDNVDDWYFSIERNHSNLSDSQINRLINSLFSQEGVILVPKRKLFEDFEHIPDMPSEGVKVIVTKPITPEYIEGFMSLGPMGEKVFSTLLS